MRTETCWTCTFYSVDGTCRIRAPLAVDSGHTIPPNPATMAPGFHVPVVKGVWPSVNSNDWCGEWKAKP